MQMLLLSQGQHLVAFKIGTMPLSGTPLCGFFADGDFVNRGNLVGRCDFDGDAQSVDSSVFAQIIKEVLVVHAWNGDELTEEDIAAIVTDMLEQDNIDGRSIFYSEE